MSSHQPSIGARFRSLHQTGKAFIIPNPWDIGTARVLAARGFEALATTSAGLAFSMGIADGGVSRDQALEHCRTIAGATVLPVSADLEKGFGDDPETVAETVGLAFETGLAGCSIEDHTGDRDRPIYAFGLAVERIQAAVEASRSLPQDFVLTARCENFLWGRKDLDDTIGRLQAFEAAGADVLYAPGLHDLETISAVCGAVSKPVNVVMGLPGATFSVSDLETAGAARISVGSALTRAAFGAFARAASEMAEHGTFRFCDGAMGFAELEAFFTGAAKRS